MRWAYATCVKDLNRLGFKPDFSKKDFTALLCGVGNEATADEFIAFVLKRNRRPRIWIIDLGEEQIAAVKELVQKKYPRADIRIERIDALVLETLIRPNSVDWIETDGFLEYFDGNSLRKLLRIWSKILKKDGFVTLRDFASTGRLDGLIDQLRVWLGRVWLGVTLYPHSDQELHNAFTGTGFRFVERGTLLPTLNRYSLAKQT